MTTRIALTIILLLACGLGTANAQDDRRVGLTMGYPASIGVLWHVTDRIAVRPEINFFRSSLTSEGTGVLGPVSNELTTRTIAPGVSALIYLARQEQLRPYVSSRFAFTNTNSSDADQPETSAYLVSGTFGAQYQLGTRFGVFGELGIEYSHSKIEFAPPTLLNISTITRRNSVATRSGVGVVLYF